MKEIGEELVGAYDPIPDLPPEMQPVQPRTVRRTPNNQNRLKVKKPSKR